MNPQTQFPLDYKICKYFYKLFMEKEKKINFFTNFYVSHENCANLKKKNLLIIYLKHLGPKKKIKR